MALRSRMAGSPCVRLGAVLDHEGAVGAANGRATGISGSLSISALPNSPIVSTEP